MNRKHLLLTILAFAALAFTAKAQEVKYTTTIGGPESSLTLSTIIPGGELKDAVTITVTGELTDGLLKGLCRALKDGSYFTESNTALTSADLSGATLIPNEGATEIGNMSYLFYKCTELETAKLPVLDENVKEISFDNVFYGCTKLQTITNLEKYTGVSNLSNAFRDCASLETITLPKPDATKKIGFSAAFRGCTVLKTIGNLDKYTKVSNFVDAFRDCASLESITMPLPDATDTPISFSGAFYGCKVLQTIGNLEQYTNVSNFSNAFYDCAALQSITLPEPANPATSISFSSAFRGCKALKTITNLERYSVSGIDNAFYDCAALQSITLPMSADATAKISFSNAFRGCTALQTIANLEQYTNVSNFSNAFYDCAALQSITLPEPANPATPISFSSAFYGCKALQTIANLELYTNVSSFVYAFYGCSFLLYVKLGNVGGTSNSNAFDGCNPNCLKYLPAGTTEKPAYWNSYGNFLAMSTDAEATALTDIALTDATSAKMNPYYCPMVFSLSEHKITYTRNFTGNYANGKNGWNTIALPFAATLYAAGEAQTPYATTTGTDGAYWLRTLDATATPANESTVNFVPVTAIEAYTPYIIAIPGNDISSTTSMQGKAITFEASGITVPATPEAMNETTSGSYRFVPTFTPIREQKMYLLERGTGENPDTFTLYGYGNLLAFRAYIADQTGTNNAPRLAIGGSGAATGIAMQQLSASDGGNRSMEIPAVTRVHSIDGRLLRTVPAEAYESRLDGLQPGIYLVNGQKEMVK